MVWVIEGHPLAEHVGFKEANDWALSVRSNKIICGEQCYYIELPYFGNNVRMKMLVLRDASCGYFS